MAFCVVSFVFVEQGNEAASDNGSGRMGAGCIERLPVTDAETYHAWITQVHILNLLEIDLFPGVEIFLCAGGGC